MDRGNWLRRACDDVPSWRLAEAANANTRGNDSIRPPAAARRKRVEPAAQDPLAGPLATPRVDFRGAVVLVAGSESTPCRSADAMVGLPTCGAGRATAVSETPGAQGRRPETACKKDTGLRQTVAGQARRFSNQESVQVEPDSEPRRVTGELQIPAEVRELFNFCGEHSCLGDMLFAAADAVAGFGEEATFPGA